jgi:RNA polymerase sigma factor (sigma-70 family)
VLAGDTERFTLLVTRYQNIVYGQAYFQLQHFEDARDAAQEAILQAYLKLGNLRDAERFGPWLRQIAINVCRARQRIRAGEPLIVQSPSIDPSDLVNRRLFVQQALSCLPEAGRLAITLYYFHCYSVDDIAEFLDEPATTIKSRLRNSRLKLRKEMLQMMKDEFQQEALPDTFAGRITATIEAARLGNVARLQALVEADPSLVSARGGDHYPLHVAAAAGRKAIVELLLANGANVNAVDTGDNALAIHFAAERGHIDVVKVLVEHGSDVNWGADVHGRGPLGWATTWQHVHEDIADYLIKHGARIDIFSAIALGRAESIRQIAAAAPEVLSARMSRFEDHMSTIMFAVSKRQYQIAEMLADLGAPVGYLELVALNREQEVRAYLAANPGKEFVDRAFRFAVSSGRLQMAELLLQHGANPDSRGNDNRTPMFLAIENADRPLAQLLLSYGADMEATDPQWRSTALGWAVFFGNVAGVEVALSLSAATAENLIGLAESGERGELRQWSEGKPQDFRRVAELLRSETHRRRNPQV